MTKIPPLYFGLIVLAVFGGLPAAGYASSRADPLDPSSPQVLAGLPASLAGLSPATSRSQSLESTPAPILRFERLSSAEGLSFSWVTSILQDEQGFMWFGTLYGLNKYDGFNFSVYTPERGGDVLTGNFINDLYQDRAGDMWLATRNGLTRLDRKTGICTHYRYDAANPQGLLPGQINTIGEDNAGTLWIGAYGGLSRFDRSTGTFTRVLWDLAVFDIYVDRQGGTWLGTDRGLWYYTSGPLEGQQPASYQHLPSDPASLSSDVVLRIYEDHQDALWVGTWDGGLNRLDRATGQFTRYQHHPDDPHSLSDNQVTAILEDHYSRLWVGTNNGLNLLDRATDRFYQYHYDPGDPYSLSSDVVQDLYQDRSGAVWVATWAGVCKLNETATRFTHYQQGSSQPRQAAGAGPASLPGLSDSVVLSVYPDRHGLLWIGTSQGGLNRLDRSTGEVTVFRHDPADPASLSPGEVAALFEDEAGTLWIGTSSGLDRFEPQTETFESVPLPQGSMATSIAEDQQGNLWVGYWGGLLRREPGASTFAQFPLAEYPSATERIQEIYPDRTGAIWISTQDAGLFRVEPATEASGARPTLVRFPQDPNDPKSPGVSPVLSFYEDASGTLWLGSIEEGLIRFDRQSQTFAHFIPDTGWARFVGCIQGDAQGFLWVGTKLGLARFDPRSEAFLYFDARDGLVAGEVLACSKSRQGEMIFGGWSGLNTFFPDQIRDNPNAPAVVITALNLRNQPLRADLLPDEQIQLSFQENYLSFDFAALDYTAPAKNQYAYKMEGLDAVWVEAGTRRHADYPDLKPGTYTFRVKASNNSGVWNETGAAVRITIAPPFWQTWWFLGLLGAVLASAVAGGIRLRVKGVEARSRDLERQVVERTGALEQKTLELQQRTLEIERRRQELEALLSADERMQRYLHLDQVLQALVDVAVDILHADKSAVIMWDDNRETLSFRVARGYSPEAIRGFQFERGEGIVAAVTLRGETVLVEDTLTDPYRSHENPHNVEIALAEGVRSFMFFPITIGQEVIGAFNVAFNQPHATGTEEQRLFQALTQRAALQIENARLYEQSRELAVLEERSRLARELHDAVTQTLFSASLMAEALPTAWEKDPGEGRGLLQELRGLSRGALAEMRTLLLELRPAALAETPLPDLLHQLGEAASGKEGIPVSVQVEGQAGLPPDVHIAFYRITQEALNNVVKHARARHVSVQLCYAGGDPAASGTGPGVPIAAGQGLRLSIRDDGRGFDLGRVPHERLGLGIMRERAQAIGASLTVDSQPGHGTQVTVLWAPAQKQEAG